MINPKKKRTLKKFSFRKEVVSKLNGRALNSIQGGANTLYNQTTDPVLCPDPDTPKLTGPIGCPSTRECTQ